MTLNNFNSYEPRGATEMQMVHLGSRTLAIQDEEGSLLYRLERMLPMVDPCSEHYEYLHGILLKLRADHSTPAEYQPLAVRPTFPRDVQQDQSKLMAFLEKIELTYQDGRPSAIQDYQESLPGFYQDAFESYDGNEMSFEEAKTLHDFYAKRRMELRKLYLQRPEDASNYDDDDSTYQQLQDALERRKQEMEFRLPYSDFRRRVLRGQPIPGPSGSPPLVDHLDQMRVNLHHNLREHKDLQKLIDELDKHDVSAGEFVPELFFYYEEAYNQDISKTLTTEEARLRRDFLNQQLMKLQDVNVRVESLQRGYHKLRDALQKRIDETKALISPSALKLRAATHDGPAPAWAPTPTPNVPAAGTPVPESSRTPIARIQYQLETPSSVLAPPAPTPNVPGSGTPVPESSRTPIARIYHPLETPSPTSNGVPESQWTPVARPRHPLEKSSSSDLVHRTVV